MLNRRQHNIHAWLLLLPALVLMAAFTHYPAIKTIFQSFFSASSAGADAEFVGLENYQYLLDDPIFFQALYNNFWYALITIPSAIILALIMALWVNSKLHGRTFMRVAYFTPTVLPMIAVANIWLFFYTPSYGLLAQIGDFFGYASPNWLGQPDTALGALMVVTIWKEAGFFMIFYLAALQGISPNLREAAAIEGAGRWFFFRKVLLPLLMPTTIFILINACINAFRLVDHLMVMTQGGPDNSSTLLLYYLYEVGFKYWDEAYAATLTVVLLLLLASIALVQFFVLDKRTHYQ